MEHDDEDEDYDNGTWRPYDGASRFQNSQEGKFGTRNEDHRESRNRMVEALQTYGIALVAAMVLLPPQLVALLMLLVGFVYIFMRYIRSPTP